MTYGVHPMVQFHRPKIAVSPLTLLHFLSRSSCTRGKQTYCTTQYNFTRSRWNPVQPLRLHPHPTSEQPKETRMEEKRAESGMDMGPLCASCVGPGLTPCLGLRLSTRRRYTPLPRIVHDVKGRCRGSDMKQETISVVSRAMKNDCCPFRRHGSRERKGRSWI